MGRRKNNNQKTQPTKLLKENTLFGIKTVDLETSIQQEDSTEYPGAKSYTTAINTTTNMVLATTNDEEDNNFRNLTTLGKAATETPGWIEVED